MANIFIQVTPHFSTTKFTSTHSPKLAPLTKKLSKKVFTTLPMTYSKHSNKTPHTFKRHDDSYVQVSLAERSRVTATLLSGHETDKYSFKPSKKILSLHSSQHCSPWLVQEFLVTDQHFAPSTHRIVHHEQVDQLHELVVTQQSMEVKPAECETFQLRIETWFDSK